MLTLSPAETELNVQAQRLLTKYDCPYKLHEVRATFMGAIASLFIADPAFELNALWDGEFPELDSEEALNEVQDVFLNRLWNTLAAHTEEDNPFVLMPLQSPRSLTELTAQAQLRGEELDAFMEGFFQDQEDFELDPEAAESLSVIEELVEMYAEIINMDPATPSTPLDLETLVENMKKMNEMAETELNNIIVLCA
jgi:hypothetical protein